VATVLVVDDDAFSREFMCTLLNFRGHEVQEASDGDIALSMLADRQPPDAVITDVLMPGLDGYGLARALRSRPATRHIPIVFSTAHYGPDEIQTWADACDVQHVIFKPAHPATVLATIDALPIHGQVSVPPAGPTAEMSRPGRSGRWGFDPAAASIVVSSELCDLLHLPSTTPALTELTRHMHPDDATQIATVADTTCRTGSPGIAEVRAVGIDGAVHELIVSCRTAPPNPASTAPRTRCRLGQDAIRIRADLQIQRQAQTDWHAVRRTVDAFHRAVLPCALPTVAGVGLAGVYLPAPHRLDIGAAWYDALAVQGDRVVLSVGKVAGHDRHPAAVMAHVLAALRAYAHDDPDPAGVLARLNQFLIDTRDDDTYATAVVALFDPDTSLLRVANGGHPPPVVITGDVDGNASAMLLTPAGPALGILSDAAFPELDLYLDAGAAFCAYTDALIDRHSDPAWPDRQRLPLVATQAFGRLTNDDPDQPPIPHLLADRIAQNMIGDTIPDDDVCLAVLRAAVAAN
jgi:serine phosphatase RsbU (regulator of sigma subunit)/DNA-binding response OmpR family regulator